MNTNSSKMAKIKADAYDLLKEEVNKLSGLKKILFESLFTRIWDIFSDDCSENDISEAVNSLDKVNSEYVRPSDVLKYDECMEYLHYGNNRVGFKRLMDARGIEQVIFKNRKIGYRKSDILALKAELDAEYKKKKFKPKKNVKNNQSDKPKIGRINKLD